MNPLSHRDTKNPFDGGAATAAGDVFLIPPFQS